MQEPLFHKFGEYHLPVIYLPFRSKAPNMRQWEQFCERLPNEHETASWDRIAAQTGANYGLCLGKASKMVAVDIDTDNPEILALVPQSPLKKRGKKGETRFFKYRDDIRAQKYHQHGIEILSTGNQTVIPPSVHPETGRNYEWLTIYDLFGQVDLPELDLAFLGALGTMPPSLHMIEGRNNKLVEMATAKVAAGESLAQIAEDLLAYDAAHHNPPLFSDPNDCYSRTVSDPWRNACALAASVQNSVVRSGAVSVPRTAEIQIVEELSILAEPLGVDPWPRGRGLLEQVYVYCASLAQGKQDALALGGGLTMLAGLASNRICLDDQGMKTMPNLMCLNLAPSGFGKNLVQDLLMDCLEPYGVLGSMTYKSGASIVQNLPKRQEQVNVLDEARNFLKAISSGEGYQQEIGDILSTLYTKSGSFFPGISSKQEDDGFGACYNPHVNILASTTVDGFKGSVTRGTASMGLLPRFLVFNQEDIGEYQNERPVHLSVHARNTLESMCERLHEAFPRPISDNGSIDVSGKGNRYNHVRLRLTPEASKFFNELDREYFNEYKMDDIDNVNHAFRRRFVENAKKLALLDRFARAPLDKESPVDTDSAIWGYSVVMRCWKSVEKIYAVTNAESAHEALMTRILQFVKNPGVKTQTEITRKFKNVRKQEFEEAMKKLIEIGSVRVEHKKSTTSGRGTDWFTFVRF